MAEETELQLAPTPGAKPEFLATIVPTENDCGILPFEITLDNYTREKWSCLATQTQQQQQIQVPWRTITITTKDARSSKKIKGFMNYLSERKKSAIGKCSIILGDDDDDCETTTGERGCFVVPFDQKFKIIDNNDEQVQFQCKVLKDRSMLAPRRSTANGIVPSKTSLSARQPPKPKQPPTNQRPPTKKSSSYSGKSTGLMGRLLGASSRTGAALAEVPKSAVIQAATNKSMSKESAKLEVMNNFRAKVEDILNKFLTDDSKPSCSIPVNMAEILRENRIDKSNAPDELTMEILRYLVYESVDEIGEDKWIAFKEPSEFMDECNITVYKEGQAPPEVLEEINKGEIPTEIKAQQRAMVAMAEKESARKEMIRDKETFGNVVNTLYEDELATLNTVKRDRRTIEEIQNMIENQNKRQKT